MLAYFSFYVHHRFGYVVGVSFHGLLPNHSAAHEQAEVFNRFIGLRCSFLVSHVYL